MLSMQEIHYYTKLAREGKVKDIIKCPFDSNDIVMVKADEDDKPILHCLGCKSTFKLSKNIEKTIQITIDKFFNQV